VDYRSVNDLLAPLNTHVPVADQLFQELGKAKYFTKFDMRAGFYQMPLDPRSQDLSSFWWGSTLYKYTRSAFGLKTCPAAFQALMDYELQRVGLTANAKCFIDDVLIHSDTFEEHIEHIRCLLVMLVECGLRAHPEKTLVCTATVSYLGMDVSAHGLTPEEAKVKALMEMPAPKDLEELRTVLGKLRYYACFCPDFSQRARPMLDLLKKGADWVFGKEQIASLDDIRKEIAQPGKALQRFDPDKPIFIHTDFSNVGMGAVLSQLDADVSRGIE
jgi:hypothetical protein